MPACSCQPSLQRRTPRPVRARCPVQNKSKEDVAAKYGSAAAPLPDEIKALTGTERYVEYDRCVRSAMPPARQTLAALPP